MPHTTDVGQYPRICRWAFHQWVKSGQVPACVRAFHTFMICSVQHTHGKVTFPPTNSQTRSQEVGTGAGDLYIPHKPNLTFHQHQVFIWNLSGLFWLSGLHCVQLSLPGSFSVENIYYLMEYSLNIDLISRIQECLSAAFALLFESAGFGMRPLVQPRSCGPPSPAGPRPDGESPVRTRAKVGCLSPEF